MSHCYSVVDMHCTFVGRSLWVNMDPCY
uniref:Uncharacterized protein n=1 Tax=Arundo donax TaxID=35708 RepID=A0A0A9AJ04_ARUDO